MSASFAFEGSRGATGGTPILRFPTGERLDSQPGEASFPASPPHELLGEVESLKRAIEAWVVGAYLKEASHRLLRQDNPFDEVYISLLRPDPIHVEDVARVRRYAHIVDLSDEIDFEDAWAE